METTQSPITAESIRSALLDRAAKYCQDRNTSLSAIGLAAVNDSKFLARVKSGLSFNVSTYQKVMDWLDAAERGSVQ
jgi:hypothetical protein